MTQQTDHNHIAYGQHRCIKCGQWGGIEMLLCPCKEPYPKPEQTDQFFCNECGSEVVVNGNTTNYFYCSDCGKAVDASKNMDNEFSDHTEDMLGKVPLKNQKIAQYCLDREAKLIQKIIDKVNSSGGDVGVKQEFIDTLNTVYSEVKNG